MISTVTDDLTIYTWYCTDCHLIAFGFIDDSWCFWYISFLLTSVMFHFIMLYTYAHCALSSLSTHRWQVWGARYPDIPPWISMLKNLRTYSQTLINTSFINTKKHSPHFVKDMSNSVLIHKRITTFLQQRFAENSFDIFYYFRIVRFFTFTFYIDKY